MNYRQVFNGLPVTGYDLPPPMEPQVVEYVRHLRRNFEEAGGNPVNFPKYLISCGLTMDGPIAKMTDEFLLLANLHA